VSPGQLGRLLALGALWGGSFPLIAVAAPALGAVGLADARMLLAAAVLVPLAVRATAGLGLRRSWAGYLLLGTLNAALPFALIAVATLAVPASLAAIVNATAPLFAALLGVLLLGERVRRRGIAGLLLGVAGVAFVVGFAPIDLTATTAAAIGASLLAALSYAAAGHLAARRFAGRPPLALAAGQLLTAGLLLAPVVAVLPPPAPRTIDATTLAIVAVLGLLCTAAAYLVYFRLVAELGATGALTVTYLVPVFGALWSAMLLGERLTAGMAVGGAIVLAGVALVTGSRAASGAPAQAPARRGEARREQAPARAR
jgi:drug/metabolite transporter (DMT)-like permease